MESITKTRIDELIEQLGITQTDFAKTCGVSTNAVTNWKSRGISGSAFEKISRAFPDVNMDWLTGGEGEAFTASQSEGDGGVPYYDVDFIGGFDIVANEQSASPDYYVHFRPFSRATCWCNVYGHSMEPEIGNGDMVALRKIDDLSFLPCGEIYAFVTKNDMRTIKRLGRSDDESCYRLIPSNSSPEYAPQDIRKDDILFVYEVMGCLKRF